MKQYLIAALLALSLSSARATEVYWVDANNNILEQWHVEDGLNKSWFQSENRGRCLKQLTLLKKAAIYGWERMLADALQEDQ